MEIKGALTGKPLISISTLKRTILALSLSETGMVELASQAKLPMEMLAMSILLTFKMTLSPAKH